MLRTVLYNEIVFHAMFKMDQGWYFLCHVRHLMKFKLDWVLPTPWNYFLFQVCLFGCSNLGFWSV